MEILTPGEKIYRLRKKIGLRQDQLTDDRITRSLISMIENGKRTLNIKTATIIAEKLNQHYKNLGKKITPEYLMESQEEQVKRIIEENLKEIEMVFQDKNSINPFHIDEVLHKMLNLANEWSLMDEVAQVMYVRGKYLQRINKYNPALMDYFSSLEYYIESKQYEKMATLYVEIGQCYFMMQLLEQAIFYNNKAYSMAIEGRLENYNEIKIKALFNMILSYRKAKKYDLAIQYIEMFKELKSVKEDIMDQIILMEANTYFDIKNYHKSKKIYKKLLAKENKLNSDTAALVYCNVLKLSRYSEEKETDDDYVINKILQLKEEISEKLKLFILVELANHYIELDKDEEALTVLREGFELAEKLSDNEALLGIALVFSKIYTKLGDHSSRETYLKLAEKIVFENNIKSRQNEVFTLLSELYCDLNNKDLCKSYLKKIRNEKDKIVS